jgi:hypothetical protein
MSPSPQLFRSSSPTSLPTTERILGYTFTTSTLRIQALITLTNKKLASSCPYIGSYSLSNNLLAHKALSLGIDKYLTLPLGCEFISEKTMATAVRVLIAAVDKKCEGERGGVCTCFWEWEVSETKVVCESDENLAGSDIEVFLGVPELSTSGASKIEGVWNGESLI